MHATVCEGKTLQPFNELETYFVTSPALLCRVLTHIVTVKGNALSAAVCGTATIVARTIEGERAARIAGERVEDGDGWDVWNPSAPIQIARLRRMGTKARCELEMALRSSRRALGYKVWKRGFRSRHDHAFGEAAQGAAQAGEGNGRRGCSPQAELAAIVRHQRAAEIAS
jgi:hypothetical protein